jgi:hypothetical protein
MGIITDTTRTIIIITAITITIIIATSDLAPPGWELARPTGGPQRGVAFRWKARRFVVRDLSRA